MISPRPLVPRRDAAFRRRPRFNALEENNIDEIKQIVQLNIEPYRQMLAGETASKKRATITRLLAEQEAKLREMERPEGKA